MWEPNKKGNHADRVSVHLVTMIVGNVYQVWNACQTKTHIYFQTYHQDAEYLKVRFYFSFLLARLYVKYSWPSFLNLSLFYTPFIQKLESSRWERHAVPVLIRPTTLIVEIVLKVYIVSLMKMQISSQTYHQDAE